MINREEAQTIAIQYVRMGCDLPDDDELVIDEQSTIEREWGWVFFYTSRKWMETGSFEYAIAGNAPAIVEKATGRIVDTGTALPIAHYIAEFEKGLT
jgi:hypothetical protein